MKTQFVTVKGIKQNFGRLQELRNEDATRFEVYKNAETMRNEMRGRVNRVTGNLRKGIVSKLFKKEIIGGAGEKEGIAFVAINYRYGGHAHLLEYGTAIRVHKSGKEVGKIEKGKFPFFRPVIDEWSGSKYLGAMQRIISQAVERNVR